MTEISEKYQCCECGRELSTARFYKSNSSIFTGIGHMTICKECFVREFKKYKILYMNQKQAMQRLCMAFDIYFSDELFDATTGKDDDSLIGNYMKKLGLGQYKDRTFDSTIDEGFFFSGEKSKFSIEKKENETNGEPIDPKLVQKWGEGLSSVVDYNILEDHYKYLKSSNPNCDSNQEIFITDLCYTKMQQMKAVREGRVDDYNKLTESYRKTFSQAGLKTVRDPSALDEFTVGVGIETIEKYTPAEYYKNKKLFKDYDGIGDYFARHILRPLRNMQYGTDDRDEEYYVKDEGDYDEYSDE